MDLFTKVFHRNASKFSSTQPHWLRVKEAEKVQKDDQEGELIHVNIEYEAEGALEEEAIVSIVSQLIIKSAVLYSRYSPTTLFSV